MNFIKYSITFKILAVATLAALIFGIGAAKELGRVSFPPIFLMWWLHFVNMIPFPGRDNLVLESLLYAFTNIFHFVGAFVSLFVIKRFVGNGVFKMKGWLPGLGVLLLVAFSISTVWHYADMFLNQERTFSQKDKIFSTFRSTFALNAWDNIICISILIQIAQASINTGLKRVFKRQVYA
jgi:hypothetical protein